MRFWMAVVTRERYDGERLYAYDTITLPGLSGAADGDHVALGAAGEPALLFALGRVLRNGDDLVIRYSQRLFDDPRHLDDDPGPPGLHALSAAEHARLVVLAGGVTSPAERNQWFVSVALPIEAASRAEAVREFWTYVDKLGPQQLPAYVWPRGDELALQAYLVGEETNLDPEEED